MADTDDDNWWVAFVIVVVFLFFFILLLWWLWPRSSRREYIPVYPAPRYSTDNQYIVEPVYVEPIVERGPIFVAEREPILVKKSVVIKPSTERKYTDYGREREPVKTSFRVRQVAPLQKATTFKAVTPHHTLATQASERQARVPPGSNKSFTKAFLVPQ